MKKVLMIFLSIALIFTMAAPVFAADNVNDKFAELKAAGVLSGDANGNMLPVGSEMQRQQLAKIACTLAGVSATPNVDIPAFADDYKTDVWGFDQGWIQAAYTNGLMLGKGDAGFDAKGTVTMAELLTVVLRAAGLGDELDNDNWKASAVQVALDNGFINISVDPDNVATYGDLVNQVYVSYETIQAQAIPAVKSVKALDATRVEVVFTEAVDSTAGKVVTNYAIGGINPASVALSSDGLTATLTFALATSVEVTNAAFVVEPIQTKANDLVSTKRYADLFSYDDKVAPSIVSIVSATRLATADKVVVTFSEPVSSQGTIKIDGVVVAGTLSAGDTVSTITGLSLAANASHTIQYIGLADKASPTNNTVANLTQTFSVTVDTVAPTAQIVPLADNAFMVLFDKDMDVATVTGTLLAASNLLKDESLGNVTYNTAIQASSFTKKAFKVVVTDATLYTGKTARNLTMVLPTGMTDSLGNAFAPTTKAVSLTKDTVAPTITSVVPKYNATKQVTDFVVTVSEGVPAVAITPSNTNIVIVDSNGVLVPTTGGGALLGGLNAVTPTAGATSFTIPVATPATMTGVYSFSFAAGLFTDTAHTPNNSAKADFTIDFGVAAGSNTFVLPPASVTQTGAAPANELTVTYANAVKGGAVTGSATDVNNYTLSGSALPAGSNITLNPAQTVATITIPANTIATTDTAAIVTVSNVTQLTGEVIVPYTQTIGVTDNTQPVMNYAVLNADNTITIGFTEALASAPVIADLVVKINGSTYTLPANTVAGVGLNAGKYVAAITVLNDGTQTYVDFDASGTYTAGDLIIKTETSMTANLINSGLVSSVTIATDAAIAVTDIATNSAKPNVVLTVK